MSDPDDRLFELLREAIPAADAQPYVTATALTVEDVRKALARVRDEMPVIAVHPENKWQYFDGISLPVRVITNPVVPEGTFYLMPSDAEMRRVVSEIFTEDPIRFTEPD